jgi:hypothetical protein
MLHECTEGCQQDIGMSRMRQQHRCEKHGLILHYAKALRSKASTGTSVRKPRKAMKRGKGMAASPEQRKKVRGLPCVVCGVMSGLNADGTVAEAVDPAHLYPRSLCPCEHADGVIPLCRFHHRIYDDASRRSELDLLPKLVDRGYNAEMAHYISDHGFSLLTLLQHVTGEDWAPLESPSRPTTGEESTPCP